MAALCHSLPHLHLRDGLHHLDMCLACEMNGGKRRVQPLTGCGSGDGMDAANAGYWRELQCC